jgi:hypothetical protein
MPVRIVSTGAVPFGAIVSGPTLTRTVAWACSEPGSSTVYLNVVVPWKFAGG